MARANVGWQGSGSFSGRRRAAGRKRCSRPTKPWRSLLTPSTGSSCDLQIARATANELSRPKGWDKPTPSQAWAGREPIQAELRRQFVELRESMLADFCAAEVGLNRSRANISRLRWSREKAELCGAAGASVPLRAHRIIEQETSGPGAGGIKPPLPGPDMDTPEVLSKKELASLERKGRNAPRTKPAALRPGKGMPARWSISVFFATGRGQVPHPLNPENAQSNSEGHSADKRSERARERERKAQRKQKAQKEFLDRLHPEEADPLEEHVKDVDAKRLGVNCDDGEACAKNCIANNRFTTGDVTEFDSWGNSRKVTLEERCKRACSRCPDGGVAVESSKQTGSGCVCTPSN